MTAAGRPLPSNAAGHAHRSDMALSLPEAGNDQGLPKEALTKTQATHLAVAGRW